eukprot:CAMPEP_0168855380 /NCGR_PEP_ID=MMETSP0727-20121128/14613_1 /TAXON_ID=265536 /ORGANISM="Amphiprora sp., Strain CCMP467" /LENGTH=727 /DNA_ID=CAMNT_0008909833 /DNA_START=44 /DNA_END=2223 /DNA_ORIENTATION=+
MVNKRNSTRETERCCYLPKPSYYDDDSTDDDDDVVDNTVDNVNGQQQQPSSAQGRNKQRPYTPCRCCLSSHGLQHSHIAIIGTGLAGLSTARSLEQVGYRRITLYERDARFDERKEGYGLTVTYDPRGTLQALGVLDDLAAVDCPSRSHYLLTPSGEVRGYFGNAFYRLEKKKTDGRRDREGPPPTQAPLRGVGQRGNLRVPRQTVRRIFLQQSNIQWGHKLLDMMQCEQDQLELVFECNSDNGDGDGDNDNNNNNNDTILRRVKHDLVIAADGIRSKVVQRWIPQAPPAKSLDVGIILGLSQGFMHPLLDERGFYTHGGGARLFVMPFEGDRMVPVSERRVMWQLSFSCKDKNSNNNNNQHQDSSLFHNKASPEQLLQHARTMCHNWHPPVPQMLAATPTSTVWGTMLCDRDPLLIYRQLKELPLQRVLVIGDALHAMSPFKGAGANQALQDGRAVAQWLDPYSTRKQTTRRLDKAVQSCLRELTQRTQRVVYESRAAARFWHYSSGKTSTTRTRTTSHDDEGDNDDNEQQQQQEQEHKFAGVPQRNLPQLTRLLREKQIRAGHVENLDESIAQVLIDSGLGQESGNEQHQEEEPLNNKDDEEEEDTHDKQSTSTDDDDDTTVVMMNTMDPDWIENVWNATTRGDLGQLRRLSWEGQRKGCWIASMVRPEDGFTPLHVAAATAATGDGSQHYPPVVAWLVREAGCDLGARNHRGETPRELAKATAS